MTNADLIAEARKLAIGYDIKVRLAGLPPVNHPNIIDRLATALEEAQARITKLEAEKNRHPGYPFVEEQK